MKLAQILFVVATALLLSASLSAAQPFNQVIVFGDSNVDSGFYKALSDPGGGTVYNSLWPSAVAHGAGAPTTNPGLMNSQFLAARFGLTANPSNTAGGTNYATSGAKNVTVNTTQTGGFRNAVPTITQISNYLTAHGGAANSQALYLIHSGDNDINYASQDTGAGPWPADPNAYVTQAANDLANAILSLRNAGANKIIVSGLAYDYPTNDAAKRALKLLYTNTLWNALTTLGVPFLRGDINSVRLAISANPAKYGFTTISNSPGNFGCTVPTGVTTAWALLCSSDPAAPSTLISPTAPQTNLFADDGHLGTAGQRLMANYLHGLVVPPRATHDFNGDGKSDIAWRQNNSSVAIWLMNGASVSSSGSLGAVPSTWQIVGQRDFNGDGKRDLLWRETTIGAVVIWFLNGAAISSTAGFGNIPTNWSVVGTGDANADGKGDILWRTTTGDLAIWLMNGAAISSSGSFGNVSTDWQVAGFTDFNGDGRADILWRNTVTGDNAIWFLDGTAVSSVAGLSNVPTTWSIVATGDFNGDGNADIVWRDATGNTAIWLMNGAAVLSAGVVGTVPTAWIVAETGDFNGDGKSDILWRNTATGDTAMWFMNGVALSSAASLGVIGTDWVIQGVNAN